MSQKHEIADSANAPWTLHALCMAEASPTTNDAAGAGPSASPPATLDDCVMGRPRVDVDLDDVEFICLLKLSLTKVALLLGVSRSTIYQRMMEEGRVNGSYTAISDNALDLLIQRLKVDHPHDGEVMMAGHLTCWCAHKVESINP